MASSESARSARFLEPRCPFSAGFRLPLWRARYRAPPPQSAWRDACPALVVRHKRDRDTRVSLIHVDPKNLEIWPIPGVRSRWTGPRGRSQVWGWSFGGRRERRDWRRPGMNIFVILHIAVNYTARCTRRCPDRTDLNCECLIPLQPRERHYQLDQSCSETANNENRELTRSSDRHESNVGGFRHEGFGCLRLTINSNLVGCSTGTSTIRSQQLRDLTSALVINHAETGTISYQAAVLGCLGPLPNGWQATQG